MSRIRIAALTLSASALVGIALHEGYRGTAYDDGVGMQTIGFGSTAGVKRGDITTVERSLITLLKDANAHGEGIKRCITVPLFQHEFDAYASLAFNIGTGAFCKSTLVRKLNALDYPGACAEILRWNRAGGRVLRGLVIRREAEYQQCMGAGG
jgi:lysozyme